ncbi:hypothetical protein M3Y97_00907100 [Aphelenchoides bicaudatus]|nr:hypothetical protein M3Y97_00907100 [Aphelenchoides bicaudatus]
MPTVKVEFPDDPQKDRVVLTIPSLNVKYVSFYTYYLLSKIGKGHYYMFDGKTLSKNNKDKLSALGFTDGCTIIAYAGMNPNNGINVNTRTRINDITELERSFTNFEEAQEHFHFPNPSLFNVSIPFSNYVSINFQDKYQGSRPDEKFKWIVHSGISRRNENMHDRLVQNKKLDQKKHGMVKLFDWTMESAQQYGFSCPAEAAIGFEFIIGTMDWLFARAQEPGIRYRFANKQAYEKALKIPNVHRLIYDRIVEALESPVFIKPVNKKQAEFDESDVVFDEVNANVQIPPERMNFVQNRDGYEYFMAKLEYKSGGPKLGLDIFHYQSRVLVSRCDPDSLAAIQFKVGDCILGIDGTPVTDKDVARHILLNSLQSQGFATVLIGRPQSIGFRHSVQSPSVAMNSDQFWHLNFCENWLKYLQTQGVSTVEAMHLIQTVLTTNPIQPPSVAMNSDVRDTAARERE